VWSSAVESIDQGRVEATAADVPTSPPPPRDDWGRYAGALVLYVGLAVATLSLHDNVLLLNWIVGPLFPVLVLYVIPTALRALVRRPRSR
jgi:hypothetical protein